MFIWSIFRAVLFFANLSFECILDLPTVTNHSVFTPQGDIKNRYHLNYFVCFYISEQSVCNSMLLLISANTYLVSIQLKTSFEVDFTVSLRVLP